ncbi:MAG TPA: energy transducer TonB [Pedobacter sp.]|jgi:TonB family protein
MAEEEIPDRIEDEVSEEVTPVYKDRSLLYMGLILGVVIAVMGYLTLFVDDPSKIFSKEDKTKLVVEDKTSVLNKSESMNDEEVRTSLVRFIEAFYYDQRRGYFDPPSYFADITETFYNYHSLTHKRLKELYWQRLEGRDNYRRNWIVSTLDFERADSKITATFWVKESYYRRALRDNYSALIKYEIIIDESGKIISLREVGTKNEEIQVTQPDSIALNEPQAAIQENEGGAAPDKVYDNTLVDIAPEYAGGTKELARFLSTNIKYPELAKQKNVQGKVYLSFIVEKDGTLTDIKVKQGIGSGCEEEAIRVLKASEKWKPGMIKDSPVRTYFSVPITFQL